MQQRMKQLQEEHHPPSAKPAAATRTAASDKPAASGGLFGMGDSPFESVVGANNLTLHCDHCRYHCCAVVPAAAAAAAAAMASARVVGAALIQFSRCVFWCREVAHEWQGGAEEPRLEGAGRVRPMQVLAGPHPPDQVPPAHTCAHAHDYVPCHVPVGLSVTVLQHYGQALWRSSDGSCGLDVALKT